MTTSRIPRIPGLAALACAVFLVISVLPAEAQSTREQLERARSEASRTKSTYERIARSFAEQQSALYTTENRINQTRSELSAAEQQMGALNENLKERVQRAYRMGGVGFFQFLLEAKSFREFSMRVITLQRQSMEDEDLILKLRRTRAELEAKQRELDAQRRVHAEQLASLEAQGRQLTISLNQAQSLVRDLEGRLRQEEIQRLFRVATSAPGSARGLTVPLDACPVAPPYHFVDSWGAPRGGGARRHKGTDLMAPHGVDIRAVVSGTISRTGTGGNAGLSIYLQGDDGNRYFYAHLSSFGASPGQRVSPGQRIGANGNTGNARGGAPHLHFEIHPGGGAAVNPYPSLVNAGC